MNDPIPDYDGKLFHLFSVCDPNSTKAPWSGGMQAWCHATSTDLTAWTTRQIAIPPESPGTGSAVSLPVGSADRKLLNATSVIVTSCIGPWRTVLWTTSDDEHLQWRKVKELQ